MFIFVNIPITSDQSVWSQPSRLISTYQLCQHPLSSLTVTLIVTLSLNLLITFGSYCVKNEPNSCPQCPPTPPHLSILVAYCLSPLSVSQIWNKVHCRYISSEPLWACRYSCWIVTNLEQPFYAKSFFSPGYFQCELSRNSNDLFFSDHFSGVSRW